MTPTVRSNPQQHVAPGDEILVATETFSTEVDGVPVTIHKDEDRVRAGHDLAQRYPHFFKPAGSVLRFDSETATQRQGEKRGDER